MKKLHLSGRQTAVLLALFEQKEEMKATATVEHVGETTLVFPGGVSLAVGSLGVQSNTKVTVTHERGTENFGYSSDVAQSAPQQTVKSGCANKPQMQSGKRG